VLLLVLEFSTQILGLGSSKKQFGNYYELKKTLWLFKTKRTACDFASIFCCGGGPFAQQHPVS
jgi:hypothetical protein